MPEETDTLPPSTITADESDADLIAAREAACKCALLAHGLLVNVNSTPEGEYDCYRSKEEGVFDLIDLEAAMLDARLAISSANDELILASRQLPELRNGAVASGFTEVHAHAAALRIAEKIVRDAFWATLTLNEIPLNGIDHTVKNFDLNRVGDTWANIRKSLQGVEQFDGQQLCVLIKRECAQARLVRQRRLNPSLAPQENAAEVSESQKQACRFELSGENWLVRFQGVQGTFRDSVGMKYIGKLLASPNRSISAMVLVSADAKTANEERLLQAIDPREKRECEEQLRRIKDGCSVQPFIDDQAIREYRERLRENREEIQEAENFNDNAALERLEKEKEHVLAELQNATGLGGRRRSLPHPGERARLSVRQALDRAYEKFEKANPSMSALADHLREGIKTEGHSYAYRPDPSIPEWSL